MLKDFKTEEEAKAYRQGFIDGQGHNGIKKDQLIIFDDKFYSGLRKRYSVNID